ncbi:MAG: hypothetical protein ACPIOQ_33385, partial [Promethearchaeia archaeon]
MREEIERRRRQRQQRPPPAADSAAAPAISDESNGEPTPLHVRDHVDCGARAASDVSSEERLQAGREGDATQATRKAA